MKEKLVRRGREYYVEMEALAGEEYEYQMCMRQSIQPLLPMKREQIDQKNMLLFSITGCKPLADAWENMWITEKQLIHIVENIIRAVDQVEEYFLYPDNLVIQKQKIYVEKNPYQKEKQKPWAEEQKEKGEWEGEFYLRFLYVPGYQQDILEQIRCFLEEVLERIDKNDVRAVLLAWNIHVMLKEPRLNWRELEACILTRDVGGDIPHEQVKGEEGKRVDLTWENMRTISDKGPEEDRRMTDIEGTDKKRDSERIRKDWILWVQGILEIFFFGLEGYLLYLIYFGGILEWKRNALLCNSAFLIINGAIWYTCQKKQQEKRKLEKLFREPIYKESLYNEPSYKKEETFEYTTLLSKNLAREEARLCGVDGKWEDIFLTCSPFIIGKNRKNTDYCIDQSVISRRHTKITKKENRYYIEDLASTNGTYLNEKPLRSGMFYEIKEWDRIRIANMEFIFRLAIEEEVTYNNVIEKP